MAVLGLVAEPLAAHPRMSTEQQGAVQLVLCLLRNLLAAPDEQPSATLAAGSGRTRLQVGGGGAQLTRGFAHVVAEAAGGPVGRVLVLSR